VEQTRHRTEVLLDGGHRAPHRPGVRNVGRDVGDPDARGLEALEIRTQLRIPVALRAAEHAEATAGLPRERQRALGCDALPISGHEQVVFVGERKRTRSRGSGSSACIRRSVRRPLSS
jgi:hypothetical protein